MTAKAMETHELKTLVETGSYKPDPAQVAMAMLSRRGVRELSDRDSTLRRRKVVVAPSLQQSAPGQPDLHPLARCDLADRGEGRLRRLLR